MLIWEPKNGDLIIIWVKTFTGRKQRTGSERTTRSADSPRRLRSRKHHWLSDQHNGDGGLLVWRESFKGGSTIFSMRGAWGKNGSQPQVPFSLQLEEFEPELRTCWIEPTIHNKINLELQGKIKPPVALSWLKPSYTLCDQSRQTISAPWVVKRRVRDACHVDFLVTVSFYLVGARWWYNRNWWIFCNMHVIWSPDSAGAFSNQSDFTGKWPQLSLMTHSIFVWLPIISACTGFLPSAVTRVLSEYRRK